MIRFSVNGQAVEVGSPPMTRLLDVLREELRLTGTKEGCGEGECGACTVRVDGRAACACLVPVAQVDGARVETVEGLAVGGRLNALQEAFLRHGAAQCGICTPGFLVMAAELLERSPHPTDAETREALAGNLCRCTGYQKIVDAVLRALAGPEPALPTAAPDPPSPRPVAEATRGAVLSPTTPAWRARTAGEAVALRAAHPGAVLLAGGTDLLVYLEAGSKPPPAFIDLHACEELRGIDADGRRVGAMTTWTEVAAHPELPPALRECARTIGAAQIQNRATVGGNIVNASPAGDSLPLWLVLDARFELLGPAGTRFVPAEAFWSGYRRTALAGDELLVAVHLPPVEGEAWYRKVGTRLAQAISKVVLGGRLVRDGAGVITEARVALGSVAPVPVRARALEAALVGRPPEPALAALVDADIQPIDDVRGTAAWRRRVARNVIAAWLAHA